MAAPASAADRVTSRPPAGTGTPSRSSTRRTKVPSTPSEDEQREQRQNRLDDEPSFTDITLDVKF